MKFLLNFPDFTEPVKDLGQRFAFAGFMLLIGLAVVFAVLIIIWCALTLFKYAFNEKAPKEKKSAPVVEAPVETPAANDAEILAVIAAAIAAAESENDGIKFKVVSFRRK